MVVTDGFTPSPPFIVGNMIITVLVSFSQHCEGGKGGIWYEISDLSDNK
jgi:hypothetical protein